MKKGGGAFPFALKKRVGGAGFSIVPKEDLGAGHLAGLHAGFGFDFTLSGKEEPISLRHTFSNWAFGCFLAFFIQVDAAAVALIGLAKFATINGFVGSVEEEFDLAGFRFSSAEDNLALDISVRASAKDLSRNKRGLVVVPDRIASGLVGGIGKLVSAIDRAADGLSCLQALKDGIDDQPNF